MKRIPRVLTLIPKERAFERGLLKGIADYSKLNGPWSFDNPPAFYLKREVGDFLQIISTLSPDGIIFREHEDRVVNKLVLGRGVPTVIIPFSEKLTHSPSVSADNKAVAQMAAEHLVEQGYHGFGYVGYNKMPWSNERGRYFVDHLAKVGYESPMLYKFMIEIEQLWRGELNYLVEWIRSLPKNTGLMACNDDCGLQICEACRIAGLRVPDDIGIVGVDNDELLCNMNHPTLSSVALSTQKAGYEIARMLDQLMHNKKVAEFPIRVNPSQIVCRESTDKMEMIGHPMVTDAIRFVRQNSNRPIQVSDVADALCVSIRTLQLEFRNSCGHTVWEEIQKARLKRVLNLLVSTNIPIKQIAMDHGFSDPKHIARFFKRQKGVSLIEYRKKHGRL